MCIEWSGRRWRLYLIAETSSSFLVRVPWHGTPIEMRISIMTMGKYFFAACPVWPFASTGLCAVCDLCVIKAYFFYDLLQPGGRTILRTSKCCRSPLGANGNLNDGCHAKWNMTLVTRVRAYNKPNGIEFMRLEIQVPHPRAHFRTILIYSMQLDFRVFLGWPTRHSHSFQPLFLPIEARWRKPIIIIFNFQYVSDWKPLFIRLKYVCPGMLDAVDVCAARGHAVDGMTLESSTCL